MKLEWFWDGDPAHFAELFAQYQPLVQRLVRPYAWDEDHAEDLSQQVWLTVYKDRKSYLGEGSFQRWLRRLATRVCIRDRRNTGAREQTLQHYRDACKEDGYPGQEPNSLAEMERDEAMAEICRVLPDLSRREQETMELLILQETSTGEAADIMGCTASTVRSHLRHALTRLRTLLQGKDP